MSSNDSNKYLDALMECLEEEYPSEDDEGDKDEESDVGMRSSKTQAVVDDADPSFSPTERSNNDTAAQVLNNQPPQNDRDIEMDRDDGRDQSAQTDCGVGRVDVQSSQSGGERGDGQTVADAGGGGRGDGQSNQDGEGDGRGDDLFSQVGGGGSRQVDVQFAADDPDGGRGREQVRRPPASPLRINSQTAKYLSSSSAKRKQVKEEHCHFCPAICSRENFEAHLQTKESCKHLYLRKHHLKTVEAILVTCFKCLYCDADFRQLNHHLKHSPNCLSKFQERFGVETVNDVTKKVTALKGQAWKSKRSLSRAIENAKVKENKKIKAQNEPLETNLNQHIQQTSFSNYKKCGNCKCSLMKAKEVLESDKCFSENGFYNLEDFAAHRRTEKYFLCSSCEEQKMQIPIFSPSKFRMLAHETESKIVLYPVLRTGDDEELESENLQIQTGQGKSVTVLFPKSFDSLETFPNNIHLKSLSGFEIQNILYGSERINRNTISIVYEHQLAKYWRRKSFGDLYHGKVIDEESKLLSSVKLCSTEHQIRGSESWKQTQNNDVQWKMMQVGKSSVYIEVDVPINISTVATSMVQDNLVLVVKFDGSPTQEMTRKYFVHTGLLH